MNINFTSFIAPFVRSVYSDYEFQGNDPISAYCPSYILWNYLWDDQSCY